MIVRPWGTFRLIKSESNQWIKELTINPGARLSLQIHKHRDEIWAPKTTGLVATIGLTSFVMRAGDWYTVLRDTQHRISNPTEQAISVIEYAYGKPDENDIVRLEDDYGRVP